MQKRRKVGWGFYYYDLYRNHPKIIFGENVSWFLINVGISADKDVITN